MLSEALISLDSGFLPPHQFQAALFSLPGSTAIIVSSGVHNYPLLMYPIRKALIDFPDRKNTYRSRAGIFIVH